MSLDKRVGPADIGIQENLTSAVNTARVKEFYYRVKEYYCYGVLLDEERLVLGMNFFWLDDAL